MPAIKVISTRLDTVEVATWIIKCILYIIRCKKLVECKSSGLELFKQYYFNKEYRENEKSMCSWVDVTLFQLIF